LSSDSTAHAAPPGTLTAFSDGLLSSSLHGAERDTPECTLTAPRADLAIRGFAISLVTSARVALGDCFLIFFLPMLLHDVRTANPSLVNLDQITPL